MLVGCLELGDLLLEPKDVPKLIHAVEQAGLVERVDGERDRAVREGQRLRGQVHAELGGFPGVSWDNVAPELREGGKRAAGGVIS